MQHSINKRTVDVPGVSNVVLQVLQGGLASHDGLDKEAKHGEHSQTAVLDLLHLQAQVITPQQECRRKSSTPQQECKPNQERQLG